MGGFFKFRDNLWKTSPSTKIKRIRTAVEVDGYNLYCGTLLPEFAAGWVAVDDIDWLFSPACRNLILVDTDIGFNSAMEKNFRTKLSGY